MAAPASVAQRLLHVSGCRIATVASVLPEAQQQSLWSGEISIPDLVAKLRYFKTLMDEIDVPVPEQRTALDEYYPEYLFRALTGADGRDTEQFRFQKYLEMFHKLICTASVGEGDNNTVTTETTISAIIGTDQDHFGDIVHYLQESSRGRHLFLTNYQGIR